MRGYREAVRAFYRRAAGIEGKSSARREVRDEPIFRMEREKWERRGSRVFFFVAGVGISRCYWELMILS